MAGKLSERSTSDLVILFLTLVVGFVVVVVTIVAVVGVLTGRGSDVAQLLKHLSSLTQSLVAVILGYVAGRNAPTERTDR